ncbi:Glycerol-3-phosphate acyltransferase [Candidatus Westeberhardia cardiocondylae]|uniref:Glycerol-3-phosphate acyltransferase n=1 Tax=Candidatus Westeberhardia cardiocondylae TaxID=1594731 RepID=A0A0H5C544_9ENTR|nr:glycerol-3-phosphate 1-O-acyltransferase PlsB [Candidatus Westeberhardia cardiocondylae]CEN32086.1 Glycerol-3-phosphate acyltransferase [Candidatus Westeberhardia cardiocondylae]
MSILLKVYFFVLNLVITVFIKSKVISRNSNFYRDLNYSFPIVYVLFQRSYFDLLILRSKCLELGFPDPFSTICISNKVFPSYVFFLDKENFFFNKHLRYMRLKEFLYKYLKLYQSNSKIVDLHLILVSVVSGKFPKKGLRKFFNFFSLWFNLLYFIKRIILIFFFGRNSFIYFFQFFSVRYITMKYDSDKYIIEKFLGVVRIFFIKQKIVSIGPKLIFYKDLLDKFFFKKRINKILKNMVDSKKISMEQAKNNVVYFIKEIAANFSYIIVYFSDKVLTFFYNRYFNGFCINNINKVFEAFNKGYNVIYIPCHRSHIDYLLVSYVMYHQGIVLPHVIAGINLNVWPIGIIFRFLGAFFIRRVFKNKFYALIFREYLFELLNQGYSIEYFIEGGRSRSGKLLRPKTGILTMLVHAALKNSFQPIVLVPIYLGYEHVIEIDMYVKELHGEIKKNDIFFILNKIRKIDNFGVCYINFGELFPLSSWLFRKIPLHYRCNNSFIQEIKRSSYLRTLVDKISIIIMIKINNAVAVHSINLCSIILLSSKKYSLKCSILLMQLACYLSLLKKVPYSREITISKLTPYEMFKYALSMKKISIRYDIFDDIIFISKKQFALMNYCKNNIQHLFIFPSFIANIIIFHIKGIHMCVLSKYIILLYPLIRSELFIRYEIDDVSAVITNFILELRRQNLLAYNSKNMFLYPVFSHLYILKLLSFNMQNRLRNYFIVFFVLKMYKKNSFCFLEKNMNMIIKKLSFYFRDDQKFYWFDQTILKDMLIFLKRKRYFTDDMVVIDKVNEIFCILCKLVNYKFLNLIKNVVSSLIRNIVI